MEFVDFVRYWLNKRNSLGMYYTIDEISRESGQPREKIDEYLKFAQQANLFCVQKTGRAMTDENLIFTWEMVAWLLKKEE